MEILKMKEASEKFVTVKQAAEIVAQMSGYRCVPWDIYYYIAHKQLKAEKIGKKTFLRKYDVQRFERQKRGIGSENYLRKNPTKGRKKGSIIAPKIRHTPFEPGSPAL